MRGIAFVVLGACSLTVSGCVLKTAMDVVTAPVRVGAKAVDLATTSQSEADEKRGREIRKREERLARLEREYRAQLERCDGGSTEACEQSRRTYAKMQELLPRIPLEPAERN
ncbi:MAG: hypothetical protein WA985_13465 [Erythrobacter sp.]|uniref:hypothetical protein n=1 Tax=Erythrobacter sp. TaxID=1042 RepID=UPI003C790CB6